jgi:RNA polymerase sigma-70 factor (ECF subfamily)
MTPVLARTRPDRAFERIYQRHVGDVYRYALAVMRNQADAEDVTQTTFLNAYRAFKRGERPEKAQNWLIAIAHNVCRQRFRQSARRPLEVSFEDDVADRYVADDDVPTGEDIRRALGHLAFNQRAALVMRELEGRSYAEIAEILELSPSAVETLIFRARRALREQLETTLTCGEAELAISRQLDKRLGRREKGALRAHLRQCPECATFARRQRAQRTALRSLGAVPLPASLTSLFGGSGGAVGTALAVKAAAAVTIGAVVGGTAYEGVRHAPWKSTRPVAAAATPVVQDVAPDAGVVPATREHTPVLAAAAASAGAHAQHGTSAAAHGRGAAKSGPAHGRGHAWGRQGVHGGNPSYRGDASVAARHQQVGVSHGRGAGSAAHPVQPSHPSHPATSHAKAKTPPGPYDAGPPRGNGGGGGGGKKSGK